MSLAEIEAELEHLAPEALRRVAIKSWSAYLAKEGGVDGGNLCDEDDPDLLAALDESVVRADAQTGEGYSGSDLRGKLGEWTSK